MSKSYKHQKMYEERRDEVSTCFDPADQPEKSFRYGNRRNDIAKMKVKERRAERKKTNQEVERDHDSASDRPNTSARPTWR